MICWLSFGVSFFFFHFHFPVPRVRSLVPGPRSLCPVLRSLFAVARSLFPVFPFPVPRSPLPVLLVLRFLLFFSFISYWTTKRLFGSTSFLSMKKQKLELLDVSMFWLMVAEELNKWFSQLMVSTAKFVFVFSPVYVFSVLCFLHRREHLQVYSAKGGKL